MLLHFYFIFIFFHCFLFLYSPPGPHHTNLTCCICLFLSFHHAFQTHQKFYTQFESLLRWALCITADSKWTHSSAVMFLWKVARSWGPDASCYLFSLLILDLTAIKSRVSRSQQLPTAAVRSYTVHRFDLSAVFTGMRLNSLPLVVASAEKLCQTQARIQTAQFPPKQRIFITLQLIGKTAWECSSFEAHYNLSPRQWACLWCWLKILQSL